MNYVELARTYGTPLYVYDARVIRERIGELKKMMGNIETEFLYAIKVNFNPWLVGLVVDEGFGVDLVSVEEARIAVRCGCPLERLMYTENNMSDDEMEEVVDLGILINFNSLYRLAEFGKRWPGSEVCVRFNPNVGAASHASNITVRLPGGDLWISENSQKEILMSGGVETVFKGQNSLV